ncbi:unnamed protein product, partial [Adineta steineri]
MTTSEKLYDIIIIGCGPAGISAALELQKYQPTPSFLILEARNRVGGRAYTDTHTFTAAEPIDLGARWIHHYRPEKPLSIHHTPSDKDRVSYQFFNDTTTTAHFDYDGTSWSAASMNEAEKIVEEFYAHIKQYDSTKEDISMFDAIRDKYEKIQDEKVRRLVDMNLAFVEHYEASNLSELSTKSFEKSDNDIKPCDLTLPIGLGSFIERIVERNHLPVQLNAIVTHINIPID